MTITAQLLRVYQVDRQIRGLRSRVQTAERRLTHRQRELTELDAKRDSLNMQTRQLEATVHNDETEIAALDERIEKIREQLTNATTNKQYSAFLTELNTFKADKAKMEERALETLTRSEEVAAQLDQVETQRIELVKLRDLASAERDEKAAAIQDRLAELECERAEAAGVVPPDTLSLYESETEFRQDDVMAPIQEMNRRRMEYCCGACQVLLPMEFVSSAINGGSIIRCSSCGAFLYIEAETREAAIPSKH